MTSSATTPEPILASWRISDVLHRYPQLLDRLLQLSPAFAPLRNPLLRKVQAHLVTVAQAAQIAGLDPIALVRDLNITAHVIPPAVAEATPPAHPEPKEQRSMSPTSPIAVELDVRPLLARGEEPFNAIMKATAQVPPGAALRLIVSFEPVPLYDVLTQRGFQHTTIQHAYDHWEILFTRTAVTTPAQSAAEKFSSQPVATPPHIQPLPPTPNAVITIDVSDLTPPEPMLRILETLEQLAPGQTLLVEHVRRPIYLYPRLDELGYLHETRELAPNRIEIRIHKPATGNAHA